MAAHPPPPQTRQQAVLESVRRAVASAKAALQQQQQQQGEPAGVAGRALEEGQQPLEPQQEQGRRLQLLFAGLALWLLSQDGDLEAVAKALRLLARLCAGHGVLEGHAARVAAAVQAHVEAKMGVQLQL